MPHYWFQVSIAPEWVSVVDLPTYVREPTGISFETWARNVGGFVSYALNKLKPTSFSELLSHRADDFDGFYQFSHGSMVRMIRSIRRFGGEVPSDWVASLPPKWRKRLFD